MSQQTARRLFHRYPPRHISLAVLSVALSITLGAQQSATAGVIRYQYQATLEALDPFHGDKQHLNGVAFLMTAEIDTNAPASALFGPQVPSRSYPTLKYNVDIPGFTYKPFAGPAYLRFDDASNSSSSDVLSFPPTNFSNSSGAQVTVPLPALLFTYDMFNGLTPQPISQLKLIRSGLSGIVPGPDNENDVYRTINIQIKSEVVPESSSVVDAGVCIVAMLIYAWTGPMVKTLGCNVAATSARDRSPVTDTAPPTNHSIP